MKEAKDLRAGNIIKVGNDPLVVLKAEYNKGARSASVVKVKMKNLFILYFCCNDCRIIRYLCTLL